jgi:NADH-quinone oxidoreductase subunit L
LAFVDLAFLILVFPILSFVICLLFGRKVQERLGTDSVGWITVIAFLASFFVSIGVFWEVVFGNAHHAIEVSTFEWMDIGNGGSLEFGLLLTNVTALMLLIVSFLIMLIALYSIGYMHDDPCKPRFFAEVSLFAVGMLGMVSSNNLLQFLIFWEIMGLCSYLLIGFWHRKPSAASAAKKAFLVTRVGDMFFLIGVVMVFFVFGTFNFIDIWDMASAGVGSGGAAVSGGTFTLMALCLFGGTVGKSAQFPLHIWLPDAMEGPTPVSALIHAATMVKAGIFLVIATYPIFLNSVDALLFVAIIGGITAIMTGAMAMVNVDIKKVLAYSTISQLSYMLMALGAGGYLILKTGDSLGYTAALFHLMNHAFFKALLFLGAGSVIHAVGTNDMRMMGGLRKLMPITSITMLFASLSIAGFPLLSGFWSKDSILEVVFEAGTYNWLFMMVWVLGIATAVITAFYMFRMWYMTFSGKPRSEYHAHESPRTMTTPLIILGVLALCSGAIALIGTGFGGTFYFHEVPHVAEHGGLLYALEHTFTNWLTYVSIGAALLGILIAYLMYYALKVSPETFTRGSIGRKAHRFLVNRMYINDAYEIFCKKTGMGWARIGDRFDRNVIDGIVNGLAQGYKRLAKRLRRVHSGYVADYAQYIAVGLVLILAITLVLLMTGGVI